VWLTDIIFASILCFVFGLLLRYWSFFKNSELSFFFLLFVFIVKVALGIAYTYIQTHYYHHPLGGDNMVFFNDAKIIYKSFFTFKQDFFKMLFTHQDQNPYYLNRYYQHMSYWNEGMQTSFYNDNRIFIKFNVLLMFFSHGNIYLHILVLNFFSLIGLVALFKGLKIWLSSVPFRIIAVFFVPAVAIWCSAIHKETLLLFIIGIAIHLLALFLDDNRKRHLVLLLLVLMISLLIKPYISLFFTCFMLVLLVSKKYGAYLKYFNLTFVISLFLGAYALSKVENLKYNLWKPLIQKQKEFGFAAVGGYFMFDHEKVIRIELKDSTQLSKAIKDSIVVPKGISYDYWYIKDFDKKLREPHSQKNETFSLLHKMPKAGSAFDLNLKITSFYDYCRSILLAEYAVLFKPLFWDAHSIFAYLVSIENGILLLIFLLAALFAFRQKFNGSSQIFLLLSFIAIVFFLQGFTVNISGALSRYRSPLMPLLLCALFSFFPVSRFQK
jgi:hypothetical protein